MSNTDHGSSFNNVWVTGALALSTVLSLLYARKVSHNSAPLEQKELSAQLSNDASIEHEMPKETRMYEQAKALNEYLLLHYGEHLSGKFSDVKDSFGNNYPLDVATSSYNYGDFGVFNTETSKIEAPIFPSYALNFPARVAQLAAHFTPKDGEKIALDVGCAVGRGTFELSPFFAAVHGIDYSHSFVDAANELKNGQGLPFTVPIEGAVTFNAVAKIGEHTRPERVTFAQGDACNLPTDIQYDCITAANLIDRLPSPRAFLRTLPAITKPGGVVVITSPYTWLSAFTPESEWLVSKDCPSTFEALQREMSGAFELVHQSHMPFLIRETARKSQFTFAHATVWKRRQE